MAKKPRPCIRCGVEIDVERLPVQVAFARVKAKKAKPKPAAAGSAMTRASRRARVTTIE